MLELVISAAETSDGGGGGAGGVWWLSGVSGVVALIALFRTIRGDKRNLFLRMHEMLLEPEVVQGRRRLYKIRSQPGTTAGTKAMQLMMSEPEEHTKVVRALALFDLLAKYVANRWIDEKTALDEWGYSLVRAAEPGRVFIKVRASEVGWQSWQDFLALAERAEKYHRGEYRARTGPFGLLRRKIKTPPVLEEKTGAAASN